MKLLLIYMFLMVTSAFATEPTVSLLCGYDARERDGDMTIVKIVTDSNGVSEVRYSYDPSPEGGRGTPVNDKLIASGLRCVTYNLDKRIVSCGNQERHEYVNSKLVETTTPHYKLTAIVVEVMTPEFTKTINFDEKDCH